MHGVSDAPKDDQNLTDGCSGHQEQMFISHDPGQAHGPPDFIHRCSSVGLLSFETTTWIALAISTAHNGKKRCCGQGINNSKNYPEMVDMHKPTSFKADSFIYQKETRY